MADIPRAGAASPLEEVRCDAGQVVVLTSSREDALMACAGAEDAVTFLAAQGVEADHSITVELVEVLPDAAASSALGCYLQTDDRVTVLTYAEAKRRETCGVPLDPSLDRSVVAHEVAHAIAACNFEPARPAIEAQEYVAYVTMFATMAPAQRERVMAQFDGDGYDSDEEMSTTIYLLDPLRFGVEAYRHFLKAPDGRAYLHRVLDGKALVE